MKNKREKIALIHIARKQAHLDEFEYRALLEGAAEITSCSELETEEEFRNIMKAFEKLGVLLKSEKDRWGCSFKQQKKIEAMWNTCARDKSNMALKNFIKRITGLDDPVWLKNRSAKDVILALSKMMEKAGFDPETGRKLCPESH